jgi:hypothetical protein
MKVHGSGLLSSGLWCLKLILERLAVSGGQSFFGSVSLAVWYITPVGLSQYQQNENLGAYASTKQQG